MSELVGFEVKESAEFGRFLIAKRDYNVTDLIWDEEPLLIASFGKETTGLSDENLLEDFSKTNVNCVGCFKTVAFEKAEFCTKCKWPVCSNDCCLESLHVKYECPIFEENKIGVSAEVYSRIYILRAVLMYKDQENRTPWEHFSSLTASSSPSQGGCLSNCEEEIQDIIQFLTQRCQINVDARIVAQITGVWDVNSFGVGEEDQNGCLAEALYPVGSLFAHSCAPNAEWIILPKDCNGVKKWHLRVYTRRNIRSGDPINISYMSDCFNLDTAARRWYLSKHFGFDCKCERCGDVTEFFLYTEAVVCPCGDETLTADTPGDEFSSWTCNHCRVSKPFTFAKTCVDDFRASCFKISMNKPYSQTSPEILISTAVKIGLGPNHREILLSTFYWIQAHSSEQIEELHEHSKRADEIFVKLMTSVTKCLRTFRICGLISDIMRLESCMARAIAAYYFKTTDFCSIPYDPYLPEERFKILTAIWNHLKIAVETMDWYPHNTFYVRVRKELESGYKFWNDELNDLKDWRSVMCNNSSDEMNGEGAKVKNQVSEPKKFPNRKSGKGASSKVLKKAVKMDKAAVGTSSALSPPDVINSPGNSNLIPPVSILSQFDI